MLLHVYVCYVGDVEGVQPTQICCFLPCLLDTVVVSVVVVVSEGEGVGRGPLAVVLLPWFSCPWWFSCVPLRRSTCTVSGGVVRLGGRRGRLLVFLGFLAGGARTV